MEMVLTTTTKAATKKTMCLQLHNFGLTTFGQVTCQLTSAYMCSTEVIPSISLWNTSVLWYLSFTEIMSDENVPEYDVMYM